MTTCTTCEAPADLYLCGACIRDLQGRIDQGRKLLPELGVTIARLDVVRRQGSEGGGGGKSGSAAPINIDAWQAKADLETDLAIDAIDYAKDPWSAEESQRVIETIQKAERMVSGPEPEIVNHAAIREKVQDIAPAMPTRQLLPWLRDNAKITLTSQHIRDWVRRGHLRPVDREPQPTYHPHEVIAAWNRKDTA